MMEEPGQDQKEQELLRFQLDLTQAMVVEISRARQEILSGPAVT